MAVGVGQICPAQHPTGLGLLRCHGRALAFHSALVEAHGGIVAGLPILGRKEVAHASKVQARGTGRQRKAS